ncbi:hypothetical protein WG902_16740 [Ramlibacter sp. PS3R-8]|uniref:hypothetical protein n=1 Tax=Ramlibacter sp. PS3R-8 TaxID=3133437 RepID=UPI00309CAF97
MRLPRPLLLSLFVVLAASAYYLVLFTGAGNPYRGGTFRGAILMDAVAVLAVFAGVEIIRTEREIAIRALAGALSFPLALVVVVTFGFGVQRYIAA